MNRFRTLNFRHSVMPFVLAALALRALIPAGFMPGSGESFAFTAMLCAPQNLGNAAMERFELPGTPDAHAQPHCDFCVSPQLGGPQAIDGTRLPAVIASVAAVHFEEQISSRTPDRAPSARAPPA
ncbi:MAG: hypothetical protein H7Y89_18655 [Steroidobacteraceae bacterium]|nr:hypothetical protein [Steroidobacteraceae bacterium]